MRTRSGRSASRWRPSCATGSSTPARRACTCTPSTGRTRFCASWRTCTSSRLPEQPIGRAGSLMALASGVLIVVGGAGVLTWLILGQVRRLLSTPADQMARLHTLVLVVYMIVPTFALGYFALARAADGQFDGLATKTDALYFTLTTPATVGFGDVVATGQIARVLISFQIVFNPVIVATAGSILASQLRGRLERTGQPHPPP